MKKRRNKKLRLRSIAVLLVVSVLLTAMPPMSSLAKEVATEGEQTAHEAWSPEEIQFPNTEGDLPLEELDTAKLLPEDTPEIVSSENIQDKGHVNRLWEQENDLNTIVFQNRDGTKTAYHYSDPVKYTDKSGKVKDKKNKLSETANGEYTNAENDINAYFPKKLHKNKGVELTFGKYTIEMAPNINGSSGASRQTGHDKDSHPTEYVEYPNVFANGVSVRYTPSFGGYKEDIILNENVGKNRFTFKLTTNGLSLVRAETGNYYLAEPLTGEYVTALGNVVVYDDTGAESEGYHHYYDVTTVTADQQYLVTVIVDERYLESEDTEYPVYVDPTLEVMPKGEVEDAALYSNSSETAYSGEIKIGYASSYGIGRGLYDFPILNFENDFIHMYGNQIVSAELNLYATIYGSNYASYNEAKTLSLYEYKSDWSPSTAKWSNTSPDEYEPLAVSSKSVTTGWTAFNILPVIEKFKSDSDYTMAFKGLLLKANSETYTTWKKFVSSSGTTSRRPYITITYNDNPTACAQVVSGATYYVKNYSGKYLDVYYGGTTDNTPLWTYEHNGTVAQQFKIVNVTGGEYEIYPQGTEEKVLSVNSSGQVIIESDCNLFQQRWYIYYRNGGYHIVNKLYKDGLMSPTYDTDYVSINNEYEYCCWELERITDPFHPCNIEYVRIKKFSIEELAMCDTTTTTVVKSAVNGEVYYQSNNLFELDYPRIVTFKIDNSLKSALNSAMSDWDNLPSLQQTLNNPLSYIASGKGKADNWVAAGYIENGSDEYYGLWVDAAFYAKYMYNHVTSLIQAVGTAATTAYCIYNAVTSIRALYQMANSTQTISNTQYVTYYHQTRSNYLGGGTGYNSFEQAKSALGSAGTNKAWHHIVEQNQISASGFAATDIHNTKNLIAIPSGYSDSVHSQITGHYATKSFAFTNGLSVREWLAGQSYQFQFEYGLQQLNKYGTVLATEIGWIFIPN